MMADGNRTEWYGSLSITIDGKDYYHKSKTPAHKKVEAHNIVSEEFCRMMNIDIARYASYTTKAKQSNISGHILSKHSIQTIYLIDLENCGKIRHYRRDGLYIGCVTFDHHSYPKWSDWTLANGMNIDEQLAGVNKLLYVIHGGVSDLADHLMSSLALPIINFTNKYHNVGEIKVITGDHAGYCTVLILEKLMSCDDNRKLDVTKSSRIS